MIPYTEESSKSFKDSDKAPLFLAIGMFDGVHIGHQSLIKSAIAEARKNRGRAGVLTFWPHPSVFFKSPQPTRMIYPAERRTHLLESLGVEEVIELPFDSGLSSIEAVDFPRWLKARYPDLQKVFVGANWHYGKGRKGNAQTLRKHGPEVGFGVEAMERVHYADGPVSSSRIRSHLQKGEIEEANKLLGRPYHVRGEVRAGRKLGRKIGFPTLNLPWTYDLLPALGVYGVRVGSVNHAESSNAVANLGMRPTVESGATQPQLEVHLLSGGSPWGEGSVLEVEWVFRLRPEQRFESLDELSAQIRRDREEALRRFAEKP
ncbi:MAG: riboflavin biosynthesis protein RibF [Opitutales bacterium]|nr:riboflavin biosynthesis protein RibF [Opitutales bacterium]MCH8539229.1 riboflavin biosynthesis protein RibF [Opitutales bacterium]